MRIVKPAWVNHDGHPIFAIDIHPDGSRFATGGQGGDAGRVCIWNMGPVENPEEEKKENVPKLLCKLDNHLACVNCLRWSHSGRWLASGGDDRIIMIWQHGGHVAINSAFAGANVEQWRPLQHLRGHAMEVLDLAWSPSDTMLATASPDNTIMIWNTAKWGEVIATLRGHTALVKGVTWDPIGEYIASQSDDKSLRIWRTKDWKQEAVITKPFEECGGTTHVLRLNWSPDGTFLVSAHAMNNAGSTAQIIERKDWQADKDFVGHRKAVTCARFSGQILLKKPSSNEESSSKKDEREENHVDGGKHRKLNGNARTKSNKQQKSVCLALGSRDRSLSIWITCLRRPLVVLHDLFENSVMDISWSKCGQKLMACSWDGTTAFIEFSEAELGKSLGKDEIHNHLLKLYGKTSLEPERSVAKKENEPPALCLIEDPDILRAHEEEKSKDATPKIEVDKNNHQSTAQKNQQNSSQISFINGASTGPLPSDLMRVSVDSRSQMNASPTRGPVIKGPIDRQIETKLPDGRRRITPLYIPPPTSSDGIPRPFTVQPDNQLSSSSSETRTKIVIEKVEGSSSLPHLTPKPDLSSSTTFMHQSSLLESKSLPSTPSLVPGADQLRNSSQAKRKIMDDHRVASEPKKKHNKTAPVYSQPSPPEVQPSHGSTAMVAAPSVPNFGTIDKISSRIPVQNQVCAALPFAGAMSGAPLQSSVSSSSHHTSQVLLPVLKLDKTASMRLPSSASSSSSNTLWLDVENHISGTTLNVLRLRSVPVVASHMSSQKETIWEVICSSKICGLAASEFIVCCACDDLTLSVFDVKSGARKLPPIVLNSSASKLHAEGYKVMLVTSTAHLWLWDLTSLFKTSSHWASPPTREQAESPLLVLKNETLAPLLYSAQSQDSNKTSPIAITSIGLIDGCSPIVNLTNGRSYLYDFSLSSWTLITARSDLLYALCDKQPPASTSDSNEDANKLHAIDSLHHIPPSTYRSMQNMLGSSSIRPLLECAALSCIDQKLMSCISLNSKKEFKFWFLELVTHLMKFNCEARLRQICADFIGPTNYSGKESQGAAQICASIPSNRARRRKSSFFRSETDSSLPDNGWEPKILGHDKRELLKEALTIIAKNVRLQRLYTEYKDLLDFVMRPPKITDSTKPRHSTEDAAPNLSEEKSLSPKNETDCSNFGKPKASPSSSSSSSYSSPTQQMNGVDELEQSQTPMEQEPSHGGDENSAKSESNPNPSKKLSSPPPTSSPCEQQNGGPES